MEVAFDTGNFSIGTTVNLVGSRYDDVANTRKLDSYSLVDLTGTYSFGSGWSAQAKVANAFDEDYETASFYYQDGRSYFLTLQYQPGQK